MSVSAGDAYWLWNPEVGIHHIHVVLTHPEFRAADHHIVVAIVNITSIRPGIHFDQTTTLTPPDFPPYITHPSYVWYQRASFKRVQDLEDETRSAVQSKSTMLATHIGKVPQELFDRITDGIQDSDFTPEDVREYCFQRHPGDGTVLRGDKPL